MTLKAIVDSADELPEPIRDHYTAGEDGRYYLTVEGRDGWNLENVAGLKSALSKQQEEARRIKQQAAQFEGLDPAEAREALEKLKEIQNWTPDDKVKEQIRSLEKQLSDKHRKEVGTLQEREQKLRKALDRRLVDSEAVAAIAENKGIVDLLLPAIRQSLRVVEVGDDFAVQVLDDEGNPRISMKPGSNQPMTIREYVATLKEDARYQRAFDGNDARGSGASSTSGRSGGGVDSGLFGQSRLSAARRNGK
jgi:hypothetical protein